MQTKYQYPLYFLICPFILASYLFERLTDDVRIYLGVGHLTDMMGGIDNAWEIKPPGNRVLFYLLSKIPETGLQYQIFLKAAVAIAAILIIAYFAIQVSRKMNADFDIVFTLSIIAMFAISDYVMLEVEWFCVLIMMLMIGALLSDNEYLWEIAGILCLPLFLMKGISLLYIPAVIALVHVIDDRSLIHDNIPFYSGAVWGIVGGVILQLTIFPHMLQDMILSSLVGVIKTDLLTHIIQFTTMTMTAYWFVPSIGVGLGLLCAVYYYDVLKHPRRFVFLLISWACVAAIPFIQGEYFQYQYAGMILTSIISILYFMQLETGWKYIFPVVAAIMILMWIIYAVSWGPIVGGYHTTYWDQRDSEAAYITENFLQNQTSVLYLDPGDAPYYFRLKSASRYICPLPVQRDLGGTALSGTDAYTTNLQDIMNYQGGYIIGYQGWFFKNMTPDKQMIADKLGSGYTIVYNKSWTVWQRV